MGDLEKPLVSLARHEKIEIAVKNALDRLNLPDLQGKRILLKPNVGRETENPLSINTNPKVVEAVFSYFKDKYDAHYYIGDSPIINTDTQKAFEQSGFTNLINEPDLQFLDLDEKPALELTIPDGKILKKIKMTGYWNDFDYIISIPVLKMHMHTGASLSFKNLKGLIYNRNKIKLHHLQAPEILEPYQSTIENIKELDLAIADLAHITKRPGLAVIDASYAQQGMGPSSGEPIKMDTIIASPDYLAADIIALALTQPQWTLKNVPHL
ncbi:MAG: DUF362 domain-containing protein, partial [Promethearchaeota archaeon]